MQRCFNRSEEMRETGSVSNNWQENLSLKNSMMSTFPSLFSKELCDSDGHYFVGFDTVDQSVSFTGLNQIVPQVTEQQLFSRTRRADGVHTWPLMA